MGQRRGGFGEFRELVERHLGGSIADQIRSQIVQWNTPAARLERKRRRASAWLTLWVVVTLIFGIGVIGLLTAVAGEPVQVAGVLVAAVITGTLAVRSGTKLREIKKRQRQLGQGGPAPAVEALPPRGSAAREPMQRLANAERVLEDLLRQVGSAGGTVPSDSVAQARAAGVEAAAALRRVAAQLHAVERAREHAPIADQPALSEAITRLREQLDEGMDGYGSLIAAAGRLVAASSTGSGRQALTDATDRLHGLAVALRELFPDKP
jgi:hypothetical protein